MLFHRSHVTEYIILMKYDRRRLGKNESRECLKVSVDEAVNGSKELIRARLLTPLLNYLLLSILY